MYTGMHRPRFTNWVKKFIAERLDSTTLKNLSPLMENFENWGDSPKPDIDDELYMAAFLATWLSS